MHLVHFFHHEHIAFLFGAEGDGEQHLLGIINVVVVEQRRIESVLECLCHTIFALAITRTHNGHAAVLEDRANIAEVKVDDAVHRDDFGNASCGDGERIVGFLKSRENVEVGIYFAQTLVVDDEEGIYVFGDFLHAIEGLVNFAISLKEEGNSDDADRQDAHVFGFACNNRCGTCACTAAHAGCNEDHLRSVVEHLADFLHAFLGGFASAFGSVACAETFLAQLETYGNGGVHERFRVGVAEYKVDFVNAFAIHVVDSVSAAATHADNLDNGGLRAGHVHVYE